MYFCLAPVISGLHAISVPFTCVVHVSTHSCVCMHVFLIFGAQLVYAYIIVVLLLSWLMRCCVHMWRRGEGDVMYMLNV